MLLAPEVTAIQGTLARAVKLHGVVMVMLPLPPEAATCAERGSNCTLQLPPACCTVKLDVPMAMTPVRISAEFVFAEAE